MDTLKNKNIIDSTPEVLEVQTADDLKSAGLLVSITINLFLFISWLIIETTDAFNAQIISYLQS